MARYCRFPSPRAVLRSPFRIIMPAAIAALIILGASGTVSAQNTSSAVVPPAAAMRRGLSGPPSISATRQRPTRTLNLAAQPKHGAPPPVVTLYENGPINGQVNAWPITSGAVVSDTFLMPSNATSITGLTFGAWLFPGDTMQSVEVSITSGPGSGTTYFDSIVDVTQASCFTNGFGDNVCSETAIFTILGLPAGNYWINLQNADVNTGDPAFWDQNSGVGCNSPGCPSMAQESQLGTIPSESFTLSGDLGNSTTTALLITPNPATAGQVVSLAATVNTSGSELVTIGTVTFFSGTQVLGTVQANDNGINTATLLTRFAPGSDTITAQYNGNRFFAESASAPQTLTVTGTEPTISTLTATPDGSNYDFTLAVFGFGFPPPIGSASVNNLTQGGFLLGNIGLVAPGVSSYLGGTNSAAGASPYLLTTGDFNGDGIPDLAVSNGNTAGQTVNVMLGNGDGTFRPPQPYQVLTGPLGIASGDFNSDGALDLAVACFQPRNQGVSVLMGNGDGTFQAQQPYQVGTEPVAVAVGDFNADGAPDLAVVDFAGPVIVLLNNGDGTFTAEQQTFPAGDEPMAIAVGDFNGDGILDLAIVGHFSQVQVLLGNGDGTFQPAAAFNTGSFPFGIAVGDLNGDGILDLAVTNIMDSSVSVLLGNGDGSFNTLPPIDIGVPIGPAGIVIADLNGDGHADLAMSTGISNGDTVTVLLGNGDGTFQPLQRYPLPVGGEPAGLVTADFNGDGVPDLAAANFVQSAVAIFLGGTVTTGQLTNIPVPGIGNQNIQSTFTPSGNFYAGSLSNMVTVIGTGGLPSLTVVTSSLNPSTYLQPVTFTATVTGRDGGIPTGTVNFTDNGTTIAGCGAVQLVAQQNSSTATCQTATLTAGIHSIVGSYSGNSNYAPSQSPPLTQQVNQAITMASMTSSPNPSLYLQPVTITMTITSPNGGSPTGTVNFTDNGTSIPGCARVTLVQQSNGSMATCTTSSLTVGTHTQIKASYGGDGNYLGGNSTLNPAQVVNQAPTTTVLASSQNPSIAMQPVTFTATVSSDERPPSGNVTFTSNGNTIPECPNPVPLMLVGTLMKASCITHSLSTWRRYHTGELHRPARYICQQFRHAGADRAGGR